MATKEWAPDGYERNMVDRLSAYLIVAERCAIRLRSLDEARRAALYGRLQGAFMGDPMQYASTLPALNDAEGRKEFWRKCEAVCFPSSPPCSPEEYLITYFTAVAASQCLQGPDLHLHPRAKEIKNMANREVLKVMEGQAACDAAVELERNSRDKPISFIHRAIRIRDDASHNITQCTVVDCGYSALNGDYVVLEDAQGCKNHVTAEEFHRIRIR